ncbi:MAG TPA: hypothetical protein VMR52_10635 [Dehalococcoidia bacterium]|nr:hypothetical protein [Dehalococcoidia bacterium]
MTETGHNNQQQGQEAAAPGGWRRYRGLLYGAGLFGLLAGVIAAAAIFGAPGEVQTEPGAYAAPTVAGASTAPALTASALTASALPRTDAPATDSPTNIALPSESSTANPTITATSSTATTPAPTIGEAVSATPTLGEAWSATPSASTPGPTTGLAPAAAALFAQIEAEWGIEIVTAGQNWGANEAQQVKNIGAIGDALASLPPAVTALATLNNHGTLAILSNNAGRTLAGWQPYGNGAANFYATEDFSADGRVETSQIVLQTGSSAMTIAHEVLHAYQMRDVVPGRYGEALLTPEMTSFMAATGWVPNVSPQVLAASVNGSWDTIAVMFDYVGPDLVYSSETGETVHAHTPNPVEAFAVVAALYYSAPDGTPLPDWGDYWAWYDANLS